MKAKKDLLSLYYCCQQKKALFIQRFEESSSVEERHYWAKEMASNEAILNHLKKNLNDFFVESDEFSLPRL